jgi:hypothetical protein
MKQRALTYAGITIIVLLLITSIIALISNSRNKRSLKEERQQKESVLSQKDVVSNELDKVKSDLASLTTNKEALEKSLADTESKLAGKDKRIVYLSGQNNLLMKDRKELEELKKSKVVLDEAYEKLKLEKETAEMRIKELQDAAIVLEADKKFLSDKLTKSEMYRTDNIEIYGSRGNKKDKLAVYACRTKKLNINFDVPQSLTETISFKIITPSGATITPENKALTWTFRKDSRYYTASLSSVSGEFELSRHIELSYVSKEKLASGEYRIQIFSNDTNIGSCRVKLK